MEGVFVQVKNHLKWIKCSRSLLQFGVSNLLCVFQALGGPSNSRVGDIISLKALGGLPSQSLAMEKVIQEQIGCLVRATETKKAELKTMENSSGRPPRPKQSQEYAELIKRKQDLRKELCTLACTLNGKREELSRLATDPWNVYQRAVALDQKTSSHIERTETEIAQLSCRLDKLTFKIRELDDVVRATQRRNVSSASGGASSSSSQTSSSRSSSSSSSSSTPTFATLQAVELVATNYDVESGTHVIVSNLSQSQRVHDTVTPPKAKAPCLFFFCCVFWVVCLLLGRLRAFYRSQAHSPVPVLFHEFACCNRMQYVKGNGWECCSSKKDHVEFRPYDALVGDYCCPNGNVLAAENLLFATCESGPFQQPFVTFDSPC
jgi:hypothetical protein